MFLTKHLSTWFFKPCSLQAPMGTVPRYFSVKFSTLWALGVAIGALAFSITGQSSEIDELSFEKCSVKLSSGATEIDAQCGILKRHENPRDTNSRIIDLSVIRLPSHSTEPETDAFTMIQGGPGGSSIDLAIAYHPVLEEIRKNRDVIVLDQRGTGRSNKLSCAQPEDTSLAFDLVIVKKLAKECATELSKTSDLKFYTTSVAVDDLEALRKAAGYSKLNLYGVSYGSRVVLHFLKKYPDSVRSAVIDGVVPTGLNLSGGEIARRWEDSFLAMNARCQENTACAQTHGDLVEAYKTLQQRFETSSITVTVAHPTTGVATEHSFNEYSLFSALRLMTYGTEQTSLLPILLSEAVKENYTFVASQSLMVESTFTDQFATGMHNAVVCAEDAPFVTAPDIDQAKGTLAGELMSKVLLSTCEVWPKGHMDEGFLTPFSSKIPVLVLSGETDPITPPANGDIATKMLGNAKHIIVPGHGHGVFTRGCVPNLMSIFIKNASFEGVDESCTSREQALPFFNTLTGPNP